jgi:HSP20 family protein
MRDLASAQHKIQRLFSDTLPRWAEIGEQTFGSWMPPVEIFEKEDNLVLRAELPGMSEKDIELAVENGILTLRGEKKQGTDLKEENIHRAERYYGSFMRTFSLPTTVEVDKIRASYKDGVLEVVLPKAEVAKSKRIEIKA